MVDQRFREAVEIAVEALVLRMMSRHDLTIDESRWAVVRGWEDLDLVVRAMSVLME